MRFGGVAIGISLGIMLSSISLLFAPSDCCLAESRMHDSIESLIEQLGDASEYVSHEAYRALVRIGKPAVPALIRALDDGNPRVHVRTVEILGTIGQPVEVVVPALIKAMSDEDSKVRGDAAFTLSQFAQSTQSVAPALIRAMGDESVYVRINAAYALVEIGEPAVPALKEALRDENADIRYGVADVLARIGEPAIPALIEILLDRFHKAAYSAAAWALKMMGEPAEKPILELFEELSRRHDGIFDAWPGIHETVRHFTPAQGQYDRAREAYLNEEYDEAKRLLMGLLESGQDEKVLRWSYRLINVGAAALDMLGKIYLKESNVPAAMGCFREMVEYGDDFFLGPLEDERIYGGPAAAQGIAEQIEILKNITPDYDAAIQLSYTLIERYDGVGKPCYENCWNYEEAAAYYITDCLRKKNAPLKDWEAELRKIISRTKNEYLQASTLLILGTKSQEFGDTGHAIQIYGEVVHRYPELYRVDEREIRGYSLEAFEKLEEIYKNQKDDEERLREVRRRMRSHYERIYQIVMKHDQAYLGSFKHRFEKDAK